MAPRCLQNGRADDGKRLCGAGSCISSLPIYKGGSGGEEPRVGPGFGLADDGKRLCGAGSCGSALLSIQGGGPGGEPVRAEPDRRPADFSQ